jgi:hypothetical protein
MPPPALGRISRSPPLKTSAPSATRYPILLFSDIKEPKEATMSLRRTSVEINEELLAAVQRVLSTATLEERRS